MKCAVVHPFKHHAYYSLNGIKKYSCDCKGYFGYYNKGDILDRLLSKTKYKKLVEGYKYSEITDCVDTNIVIKFMFLLFKICPNKLQKFYSSQFQKWAICKIKKDKIDCIYVLQDYCNEVIRYAKENNIKVIYDQIIAFDFENYLENEKRKESDFSHKLNNEVYNLKNVDTIIAPSQFVVNSFKGYSFSNEIERKVHLINYGGDVSKYVFKQRKYDNNDKLNLIFVGRICKLKGLDYLINAMKMLEEYNIVLNVIGASYNNEGQELIDIMNEQKNINYIGTIPHKQMEKEYQKADVFILPSLAEGSSLSIFEAMATGLPCIVSENTGSTITDGKEGYVIKTKCIQDIVDAIMNIYNNPNQVEIMSTNARKNVEKYSWNLFSTKINEVLKNIN